MQSQKRRGSATSDPLLPGLVREFLKLQAGHIDIDIDIDTYIYEISLKSHQQVATHSSILAWEIPWTEEPGGIQSVGPQRV